MFGILFLRRSRWSLFNWSSHLVRGRHKDLFPLRILLNATAPDLFATRSIISGIWYNRPRPPHFSEISILPYSRHLDTVQRFSSVCFVRVRVERSYVITTGRISVQPLIPLSNLVGPKKRLFPDRSLAFIPANASSFRVKRESPRILKPPSYSLSHSLYLSLFLSLSSSRAL